jgi:hypothetical protein
MRTKALQPLFPVSREILSYLAKGYYEKWQKGTMSPKTGKLPHRSTLKLPKEKVHLPPLHLPQRSPTPH